MCGNKLALSGMLLALFLFGLTPPVMAKDLSVFQTALRISQDELKVAEAERDADAQQVARTEAEVILLKEQLEAQRKKSVQSEKRYIESKKRYEKAQANMDQAWKK